MVHRDKDMLIKLKQIHAFLEGHASGHNAPETARRDQIASSKIYKVIVRVRALEEFWS